MRASTKGWAACGAVLAAASCGPAIAAQTGARIFGGECAACHQQDGAGAPGLAPPLRGTLKADSTTPEGRVYLSQILVSGMAGPIRSGGQGWNGLMPSFARYSDAELAATIDYVLTQFNGVSATDSSLITPAQIAAHRTPQPSPGDTRKLRESLKP